MLFALSIWHRAHFVGITLTKTLSYIYIKKCGKEENSQYTFPEELSGGSSSQEMRESSWFSPLYYTKMFWSECAPE